MATHKSTGPTTPSGKARSSQNSLKHGLSSKKVLLPTESAEEFAELRQSHFDLFRPTNPVEAELVETLAATRWRLRRLSTIEANLFNNYIQENAADYLPDALPESDDEAKLAWSFKRLAEGNALTLLVRYEATLTRTYDRTLKQLQTLQNMRRESPPPISQNEPKPESQPCTQVHPVHPVHRCNESPRPIPPNPTQSTRISPNTLLPPAPKV